ncbi:hypothetical protein GCM10019016_016750 [Streptomyces prasinosporus]|uniref:Uncharacterized protein n=1 Tax=Streptomyces prasinosporus TaxID=68256 RepID=A0ABP6THB7_9ACTN
MLSWERWRPGEDDPLVAEFGEDRGGGAEGRGRVREGPDDVGAVFDLPVRPFRRAGGPGLLPVPVGKSANAVRSSLAPRNIPRDPEELPAEHAGDGVECPPSNGTGEVSPVRPREKAVDRPPSRRVE